MAQTNYSMKARLEKIIELEADVKRRKKEKDFYEKLFEDSYSEDIEGKLKISRYMFDEAVKKLRSYKIELEHDYNMNAFGYDSPVRMQDDYYAKLFKHNGYLVGIRL